MIDSTDFISCSYSEHFVQELIKKQNVLLSLLCMERQQTSILKKELDNLKTSGRDDLEATILNEVESILASGQSCSCFIVRCESDFNNNDSTEESTLIHPVRLNDIPMTVSLTYTEKYLSSM